MAHPSLTTPQKVNKPLFGVLGPLFLEDVAEFPHSTLSVRSIDLYIYDDFGKERFARLSQHKPCQQQALLRHLMDSGTWSSTRELAEAIWGSDDDQPENINLISVLICNLRKKLRPGFRIESRSGRASWGYRLVIEEEALEQILLEGVARALAA